MSGKFKTPEELGKKEERRPVSARVRKSSYLTLELAAKKSKRKTADLVAEVLEEYVIFLRESGYK